MKRKGCLLLSFLMLLGFAGCTVSEDLQSFQGQWFDVNGDTTLEVKGDKMTISSGDWSERYTIHLEEEGTAQYLDSNKDYAFGGMSRLEVRKDGSLQAYEQVLDGEGHDYRFVREEQFAVEKEIRNESKDMPKSIESDEIESFSLTLKIDGVSYGIDEEWPQGQFCWTLERQENGSYKLLVDIMGPSYIALRYNGTTDEAYAKGLAKRIVDLDIPSLNGYYMTNNVRSHSYDLSVTYASGEKLTVGASGDAADTCPFDVNALMFYVKEIALAGGLLDD